MRHIVTGFAALLLFSAAASAQVCDSAASVFVGKPKIIITNLGAPAGDERLRFKGEVVFPFPFNPPIDPIAKGVRVIMKDDVGGTIIDATIPGGAFDNATLKGWFGHDGKFLYKQLGLAVPAHGIRKVVVKDRSNHSPGLLRFTVSGKNGTYPLLTGNLPIQATMVFDPSTPNTPQCGFATFPGPPPLPVCAPDPSGTAVVCK